MIFSIKLCLGFYMQASKMRMPAVFFSLYETKHVHQVLMFLSQIDQNDL